MKRCSFIATSKNSPYYTTELHPRYNFCIFVSEPSVLNFVLEKQPCAYILQTRNKNFILKFHMLPQPLINHEHRRVLLTYSSSCVEPSSDKIPDLNDDDIIHARPKISNCNLKESVREQKMKVGKCKEQKRKKWKKVIGKREEEKEEKEWVIMGRTCYSNRKLWHGIKHVGMLSLFYFSPLFCHHYNVKPSKENAR